MVLSVLSGGTHSPYKKDRVDQELMTNYSLYNDFFDKFAKMMNEEVNFNNASPGFVAFKWGTEMPTFLRGLIRCVQTFGNSPDECAGFMMRPILQCSRGEIDFEIPNGRTKGLYIMIEDATSGKLSKGHTEGSYGESLEFCKRCMLYVLGRAGITVEYDQIRS